VPLPSSAPGFPSLTPLFFYFLILGFLRIAWLPSVLLGLPSGTPGLSMQLIHNTYRFISAHVQIVALQQLERTIDVRPPSRSLYSKDQLHLPSTLLGMDNQPSPISTTHSVFNSCQKLVLDRIVLDLRLRVRAQTTIYRIVTCTPQRRHYVIIQ